MRPWASALLPAALTSVCARASVFLPRSPSAAGKVAFVSPAATAVRSLGRWSSQQQQWRRFTSTRCSSPLAADKSSGDPHRHQQPCRGLLRQRPGVATGLSTLLAAGRGRRRSISSSSVGDDNREGESNSNPATDLVSGDTTLAAWPSTLSPANNSIGLAEAVKQAAQWLDIHGVVDPEPSASELLAKVAGFRSPQEMLSRQQQQSPGYPGKERSSIELSTAAWDDFRHLCTLRAAQHVPIQYLVGEWDFYGLSLEMKPPTLIPRPETEELVEIILKWLRRDVPKLAGGGAGEGAVRFLDVGSGTGAIGLALLNELPAEVQCVAIDAQESAVHLSRRNAERTGLQDRYTCFHAEVAEFGVELGPADVMSSTRDSPGVAAGVVARDESGAVEDSASSLENRAGRKGLTPDMHGGFDFIVSNPPYIPRRDMEALPRDVADHEDGVALDGGEDGLDVVRDIVGRCPRLLRSGGPRQLWMEVDTSHPEVIQRWLGLPVGLGGEDMRGGSQECQAHGVTRLEWMRDMSRRPRFVRLTFAEEDGSG